MTGGGRPRVVVVGLGPASPDLLAPAAVAAMTAADHCFVRTERHPSAQAAMAAAAAGGRVVEPLDALYEAAADFEGVYAAIVDRIVAEARSAAGRGGDGYVCYAVPGSPLVAERTVDLLRGRQDLQVEIVPAVSFLDLAWARLGIDPVDAGVRLIDAAVFAVDGAGQPGPFLVAQCHRRDLLSGVKLAVGEWADQAATPPPQAVLLHHLGLADEQVVRVPWADLDRTIEPDHLTALWVPAWGRGVSSESARLEELVRTLRERCPWDRRQTHASLAPHLLEEAYEAVDAIAALGPGAPPGGGTVAGAASDEGPVAAELRPAQAEHLLEELGDVAFQVYFHAQLATEAGWFTVGDVLRAVHDKLVHRHPHVFGDAVADTAEDVAARWEVLKQTEKGRTSVFEGIPSALPALASAAKVQRRAESIGVAPAPAGPDASELVADLSRATAGLPATGVARADVGPADKGPADVVPAEVARADVGPADVAPATAGRAPAGHVDALVGRALFAVVDLARRSGVDPETALRAATAEFRRRAEQDR